MMYLYMGGYGYGYGYGYGFDWTYLLVLIGVGLSMLASAKVNGTFNKYAKTRAKSGITGAEAAKRILNAQGIYDVSVRHVSGNLTDHYDPRTKTVKLSDTVFDSSSISAVAVAAHECGHVVQDAKEYVPMRMRSAIVPIANIGSSLSMPLILLGLFLGEMGPMLISLGILMFSAAVLFQLVTLPVEFDASRRALAILKDSGMLADSEVKQAKSVLSAAALTYVAGAAAAMLQLLRLIILFGGRRKND